MSVPFAMHTRSGEHTSKVEWEQFLEPNGDDVWRSLLLGEERGHLKRGRKPVDEILRKSCTGLEVGVVRADLHEELFIYVTHCKGRGLCRLFE